MLNRVDFLLYVNAQGWLDCCPVVNSLYCDGPAKVS